MIELLIVRIRVSNVLSQLKIDQQSKINFRIKFKKSELSKLMKDSEIENRSS